MTDKQIIIDGVDVSGCVNRNDFKLASYDCYLNGGCQCKDNPNCYYKQLKREEQECEELKKVNEEKNELLTKLGCPTIATARRKTFTLQQQLDQLKSKNEELKKVNKHIENNRKQKADKLMRIEKLIIACSTGYTDEFIQELLVILHEPEPSSFENKYKTILEEIKEIAEGRNNYPCSWCIKKEILQKISEVGDEN